MPTSNDKAEIVDVMPFSYERVPLQEASGNSQLKVRGVLQRANAKNQNGRIYPKNILKREIEKYKREKVNERLSLGELDHPSESTVNLKNVSHLVTDVWWEGNDVMGEVEVLPTPNGNILKNLIEANVNVGISSRGMGSVHNAGSDTLKVGEDFDLIAWDFVSNPSTHGAFMEQLNEAYRSQFNKNINSWDYANSLATKIITELSDEYTQTVKDQ